MGALQVRVITDNDFDLEEFYEMNKGRPLAGIIERVRDGGCVSVYVLPEFQYVNLLLSGISAPRQKKDQETGQVEVCETPCDSPAACEWPQRHGWPPSTASTQCCLVTAWGRVVQIEPFYYESKYVMESIALQRNCLFYLDQAPHAPAPSTRPTPGSRRPGTVSMLV